MRESVKIQGAKIRKGKRVPLEWHIRQAAIDRLSIQFGMVCWYCGDGITRQSLHLEHIVPLSNSGADNIYNLALACSFCNRAKWDKTVDEFVAWIKKVRSLNSFPAHLPIKSFRVVDKCANGG